MILGFQCIYRFFPFLALFCWLEISNKILKITDEIKGMHEIFYVWVWCLLQGFGICRNNMFSIPSQKSFNVIMNGCEILLNSFLYLFRWLFINNFSWTWNVVVMIMNFSNFEPIKNSWKKLNLSCVLLDLEHNVYIQEWDCTIIFCCYYNIIIQVCYVGYRSFEEWIVKVSII